MEAARGNPGSLDGVRAHLAKRLRSRLHEIEQAIFSRIQHAVPDSAGSLDLEYRASVRETITAVVDYSLRCIELGAARAGPTPPQAAAQARRSARAGVSLGTVLRRYVAAHGELGEFVMEEAQRCGLLNDKAALHHLRRAQEALLERLTAVIEHEYNHERDRIAGSPDQRRTEIVRQLLLGEPADPAELAELDYEFHIPWHVGLIATGAGPEEVIRRLKAHFERRLLTVSLDGRVWAWLGGHGKPPMSDIERLVRNGLVGLLVAIGEPRGGMDGWRLTHAQAQEALGLASQKPERFASYGDGRVLAAIVQNDTLAQSLTQMYLVPLHAQRDGGARLLRTLRVYIALECNATCAAESLQVGRRTVKSRVRTAEELIGCPLRECLGELDAALRLDALERAGATNDGRSPQ
jgi:hypothetical protein